MASRRKPWEAELGRGATSAEITRFVLGNERPRPPKPCEPYPQYIELMKRCWAPAPRNRPAFHEIATMLKKILDDLPEEEE